MKRLNCRERIVIIISAFFLFFLLIILASSTRIVVKKGNNYYTKREVALYLYKYDTLPLNFITKEQATIKYGNDYLAIPDGYNIGGDACEYQGAITLLTSTPNLFECDIYSNRKAIIRGKNRGMERLVYGWNDKIEIYYTNDNGASFDRYTRFEVQIVSNIFWIIFGLYNIALASYVFIDWIKGKDEGFIDDTWVGFLRDLFREIKEKASRV